MKSFVLLACGLVLSTACRSVDAGALRNSVDASQASAVFERLKALQGDWSGMATMGGELFPVETSWRSTGGGSAVVETLFVGTRHEMVTMYHRDGTRLMLTHYCAAQNLPRMVATPAATPSGADFAVQFA